MKKSLLIIAGEASGDMHAADVVREMKMRNPDIECWGVGGEKLRGLDVETLRDIKEMDVMGFVEVIRRYPFFRKVFREVLTEVDRRKPDAALLVDYPGFNLRLAKELNKRGVKVLYYICPQVWAWNRGRIPKMARILDRLMVIFPFETDVFKGTGLSVDFVGHPMVEELRAFREEEPEPLPWNGEKKIALLPGSREQEIRYILKPLLETAQILEQSRPDLSFVIPVPESRVQLLEGLLQDSKNVPLNLSVVTGHSREVLKQADAAFVASGTATLEAALLGCPAVLVYRSSLVNYCIARSLIRVSRIGIVNIVSDCEIMPECIQKNMVPIRLAAAIEPLMNDTPMRTAMLEHFKALEKKLGARKPAGRVAQIICEEIMDRSSV